MKNSKMSLELKFTAPHILSEMPPDTPILLALSGGADSSALLAALNEYCQRNGARLSVAHVNHMIRGLDAERDRDFCRGLAERYSLPFYLLEADVPALAKEHKRGLEEEAREVRYGFFEKIMRENSIPLLATAHNATDNAETVIFNLSRGCGLHGLCGIPAVRDFSGGRIIRPLLKASKDEILAYCKENGIEYVTDGTNTDVAYSRNRIRNNILPELLKINENAISNIGRMSELIKGDDRFIESCAREYLDSLDDRYSLPLDGFALLDGAVAARTVSLILNEFFEASTVHISDVLSLAKNRVPHSEVSLPNKTRAVIESGHVVLTQEEKSDGIAYSLRLGFGENLIPHIDAAVFIRNTENSDKIHDKLKNIYKKSTIAFISSDTIVEGLYARPKKDGDKILHGGVHKKLKKLYCEKKLTLEERASLPVFCDQDGIVWIPNIALRDGENKKDNLVEVTFFYN